jgi:plasmid stabilization system protein ParE
MKRIVLTPLAQQSLADIIENTYNIFGPQQALDYRNQLSARLQRLADGETPHGRSCATLIDDESVSALSYIREGGHYIIFVETEAEIAVLEFVHQRRNLPQLLELIADSKR